MPTSPATPTPRSPPAFPGAPAGGSTPASPLILGGSPGLPPPPAAPASLSRYLWSQRVPLIISHVSSPSGPFFVASVPRFGYLALLLPQLGAFFTGKACSSFHHEDVLLRNLPLGLLVDLYRPPSLPWRLTVGDGPAWDIADTFINGVKEAAFIRFGTAKSVLAMSKDDTTTLWNAVQDSTCPPPRLFFLELQPPTEPDRGSSSSHRALPASLPVPGMQMMHLLPTPRSWELSHVGCDGDIASALTADMGSITRFMTQY